MKEEKIEKKLKRYIKVFVIVGIAIVIVLSVTASYILIDTLINSKDVYYQDNSSLGVTNVQATTDRTCTKFNTQLTTLQTSINNQINTAKTDVLNKAYPVGSIYTSVNNTSPATLFGGTWEQLKDRFLLGAGTTYTAGSTGGEATHTHTLQSGYAMIGSPRGNNTGIGFVAAGGDMETSSAYSVGGNTGYASGHPKRSHNTKLGGSTDESSSMPPYLVVYMWKRTK